MLGSVIDETIKNFCGRFKAEINFDDSAVDAIVAAVSNPKYKLRWITDLALTDKAKNFFTREVAKMKEVPEIQIDLEEQQPVDDFLIFQQSHSDDNEANSYLNSSCSSYESLEAFPTVKKVFIKFNTPLNSSGSIERIFSLAGVLNDDKRGAVTPANFEKCIFIKGNEVYKNSA